MRNIKKTQKKGFTLLEVSLFLALSGILLVGIIAATRNNIARQRYNNAVQEYADFLRSIYTSTIYVQNLDGNGRSDQAIYGRLVVFGENNSSTIYTYDLVGNVVNSTTAINLAENNDPLAVLRSTTENVAGNITNGLDVVLKNRNEYTPNWGMTIKSTDNNLFKGALVVFRSPTLGTIHTYHLKDNALATDISDQKLSTVLKDKNLQATGSADDAQLDFCVDSDDRAFSIGRKFQDIRIVYPADSSSAVSLINVDTGDNKCEES